MWQCRSQRRWRADQLRSGGAGSLNNCKKIQIDFITLRRRDRKECKDARILKSADCGTDHHLVWAKIEGCAWSKTLRKRKPHELQLANLRTKEGAANFEAELKIKMSSKQLNWPDFSQALVATASEQCPKEQQPNKPWIDSECWELIEERRSAKKEHFQGERYRELCKAVVLPTCEKKMVTRKGRSG